MATNRKIALITGSNSGIGFEIARQLGQKGITVLVATRNPDRGQSATAALRKEGITAEFVHLDAADPATVRAAAADVETRFGVLDILVNNAGTMLDFTPVPTQPSQLDLDITRRTFDVNFFGPLAVIQAFLPLLRKSEAGRIVNVSSLIGSLAEIGNPESPYKDMWAPAYQASKTALNALTVLFAKELKGTSIKVNSACPGWVATDMGVPAWLREAMGGTGPALPVAEGADTPVWLATLPENGPSGRFFQRRTEVAW